MDYLPNYINRGYPWSQRIRIPDAVVSDTIKAEFRARASDIDAIATFTGNVDANKEISIQIQADRTGTISADVVFCDIQLSRGTALGIYAVLPAIPVRNPFTKGSGAGLPLGNGITQEEEHMSIVILPAANLKGRDGDILRGVRDVTGQTAQITVEDVGMAIVGRSGQPQTFTVQSQSSQDWPVGTIVNILQRGPGQITIVGAAGVTVSSFGNTSMTAGVGAWASLIRLAENDWALSGNLV